MSARHPAGPLLLLLLATACATIPEAPAPPAALVLPEAGAEWRSLRGLARLTAAGPGGSGSMREAVLVALPDRGRLETVTPLGTTAAVLVLAGGEIRIFDALSREFAAGAATAETVRRLTGIPAPPAVLLRLLAGLPPLAVSRQDPRTRTGSDGGGQWLESVDGPFWQRIRLPAGTDPVRGEVGDAAGPLLAFEWSAVRMADGVPFPHTIAVVATEARASLTLQYEWVRLGEALEAALFELPRPSDPGVAQRELGSRPLFGPDR